MNESGRVLPPFLAQAVAQVEAAGYVVVPRVEAELVAEDAAQWCGHVADETYGHLDRFRDHLSAPARTPS